MWHTRDCHRTVDCSVVDDATLTKMRKIDAISVFKYDSCLPCRFLIGSQVVINDDLGYAILLNVGGMWCIEKIRYLHTVKAKLIELLREIGVYYKNVVFSIPARVSSSDKTGIAYRNLLLTIASHSGYGVNQQSLTQKCLNMFYPSQVTQTETIAYATSVFKNAKSNSQYTKIAPSSEPTHKIRQVVGGEETLTDVEKEGYEVFKYRLFREQHYEDMRPHVVDIWRQWRAVEQCELCQTMLEIVPVTYSHGKIVVQDEMFLPDAIDHVHSLQGLGENTYRGRLCRRCNTQEGVVLKDLSGGDNDNATNIDFGEHVRKLSEMIGRDDKLVADYLSRKTQQYNEQSVVEYFTEHAIKEYEDEANRFLTQAEKNIRKKLPQYKGRQHDFYIDLLNIIRGWTQYKRVSEMLERGTYDFDSVSIYVDRVEVMEVVTDVTNQLRQALLADFNEVMTSYD